MGERVGGGGCAAEWCSRDAGMDSRRPGHAAVSGCRPMCRRRLDTDRAKPRGAEIEITGGDRRHCKPCGTVVPLMRETRPILPICKPSTAF